MSHKMTRRGLIAGSIAGAAGIMGLEERILLAAMQEGATQTQQNHPPQMKPKSPQANSATSQSAG